jgi:uncharacterized membrane protein
VIKPVRIKLKIGELFKKLRTNQCIYNFGVISMKNTRMVAFIFSLIVFTGLSTVLSSCHTTQQDSTSTDGHVGGHGGYGGHGGGR